MIFDNAVRRAIAPKIKGKSPVIGIGLSAYRIFNNFGWIDRACRIAAIKNIVTLLGVRMTVVASKLDSIKMVVLSCYPVKS
ncbi:MAG: hypothetical protein AAFQ41_16840 [Cyanobacteria bacterium J06623_7]